MIERLKYTIVVSLNGTIKIQILPFVCGIPFSLCLRLRLVQQMTEMTELHTIIDYSHVIRF